MGSGKTTVGRRVAELAGAEFVDLDDAVVGAAGRSIAEVFESAGEAGFRRLERETFPTLLAPGRVIALGGGAAQQDEIWHRVREEALSVFLDAPVPVLRHRVGDGQGRPLAAGDFAELLERRLPRYREADRTVDATRGVDEVAQEVWALWSA